MNYNALSIQMGKSATMIKILTNSLLQHCIYYVIMSFIAEILLDLDQLAVHIEKI